MKRNFLNILLAAAAAFPLFAAASCDKDGENTENPDKNGGETVTGNPIGAYEFDGRTFDIFTATCNEENNFLTFIFSPESPENGPLDTYAVIGVDQYWADGEEHDITAEFLDHNDDYIFVYEDPDRYYSQYRELLGGTFCVTRIGGGYFMVQADFTLADGTPFKINFFGEMLTASEENGGLQDPDTIIIQQI